MIGFVFTRSTDDCSMMLHTGQRKGLKAVGSYLTDEKWKIRQEDEYK